MSPAAKSNSCSGYCSCRRFTCRPLLYTGLQPPQYLMPISLTRTTSFTSGISFWTSAAISSSVVSLADGHPEQCPVRRIFKTPSAYSTICTSPSWDNSAGRTFFSNTSSILSIIVIPPDLPSKDRGLFRCSESGTHTALRILCP